MTRFDVPQVSCQVCGNSDDRLAMLRAAAYLERGGKQKRFKKWAETQADTFLCFDGTIIVFFF